MFRKKPWCELDCCKCNFNGTAGEATIWGVCWTILWRMDDGNIFYSEKIVHPYWVVPSLMIYWLIKGLCREFDISGFKSVGGCGPFWSWISTIDFVKCATTGPLVSNRSHVHRPYERWKDTLKDQSGSMRLKLVHTMSGHHVGEKVKWKYS